MVCLHRLAGIGRLGQHRLDAKGVGQAAATPAPHAPSEEDAAFRQQGSDAHGIVVMFVRLGVGVGPSLDQFLLDD